jgi:hypothetical protein
LPPKNIFFRLWKRSSLDHSHPKEFLDSKPQMRSFTNTRKKARKPRKKLEDNLATSSCSPKKNIACTCTSCCCLRKDNKACALYEPGQAFSLEK